MGEAMRTFLGVAGVVVLVTVAGGLLGILRERAEADKMMATQLLSTGGIAVLLLGGVAGDVASVLDVAMVLALLAAFAAIAFVKKGSASEMPDASAGVMAGEQAPAERAHEGRRSVRGAADRRKRRR